MERLEEWLLSLVECVWRDQCDIVREARLSGNKLEQSSGCGEAVDKAVQQHGVSSVLVKYVVGSVICEVCLVWHRFCVEWVASDVLDDQEKDVEHTVE